MTSVDKKQLNEILCLLFNAQMFFFRKIESSSWHSTEAVNAFDKLDYALRFARNPENEIPVCCRCGGIYYQELGSRDIRCLDCDFIWVWSAEGANDATQEEELSAHSDIHTVISSLKRSLDFLAQYEEPNLKKSAIYVQQSIEWAVKQK